MFKSNASQHKWVQPNEMQVEQTCTDLRWLVSLFSQGFTLTKCNTLVYSKFHHYSLKESSSHFYMYMYPKLDNHTFWLFRSLGILNFIFYIICCLYNIIMIITLTISHQFSTISSYLTYKTCTKLQYYAGPKMYILHSLC